MAEHSEQRRRPRRDPGPGWASARFYDRPDDLEQDLARAIGGHEPSRALSELVVQLVKLSRESVRDARIAARRAANAERLAIVAIAIAVAAIITVLV